MKEIKFRAFTDGKMYDVNVLVFLGGKLKEVLVGSMDMPIKREPHEVTLMQFTGLHDKNGKEIYEGDVVNHADCPDGPSHEVHIYSILWNDSGFALLSPKSEIPTSFILDKKWGVLLEIIGNIYENPELLKP